MMEEEIQMLFRLSMPEDWRNRMPSTPPPPPHLDEEEENNEGAALGLGGKLKSTPTASNFWSDVGLRSYAQMDFDLELSLNERGGGGRGYGHRGVRRRKPSSPTPLGGLMYQNDRPPKSKDRKEEDNSRGGGGEDEYDAANEVPPNALCLINILRLTADCPFSDIRKQAANVLFLLREKGVPIPYSLINGPCTFIHPSECPSITVDKYAAELGLSEDGMREEEGAVGGEDIDDGILDTFCDLNEQEAHQLESLEFQKTTGYVFVLWVWLFCSFWLLVTLAIYPNVIAPIFNTYTPLRDGHLRDKLEKLANFIEFPLDEILVIHQKEKTAHIDAYSFGLLSSKRIVLYDTLLDGYPEADLKEPKTKRKRSKPPPPAPKKKKHNGGDVDDEDDLDAVPSRILHQLKPDHISRSASVATRSRNTMYDHGFTEFEIEALVAREMGHWWLGHAAKEIIVPEFNLFIFFFIFGFVYQSSTLYTAFMVPQNLKKPSVLGLKLLYMDVMDIYKFMVDNIMKHIGRAYHYEADDFATKLGYGEDLIDAIIELNKENLKYPYFDKWYWASQNHVPAALDRIAAIEKHMKMKHFRR